MTDSVLGGRLGLLGRALAGEPGRPFITWYDERAWYGDGSGARVELSVTAVANWVAKTANLLVDGLGLGPTDTLRLDLPRHWQLPVWALSAWTVGLVVDLDGDPAGADLAVCGPGGIAAASSAAEVVAVSLHPLGAPFPPGELPAGALDAGREVAGYGDRYDGPPDQAAAVAIRSAAGELTLGEAADRARGLAAAWGLAEGGRLLVSGPLAPLEELLASTLVPLVVGGSVVLVVPGSGAAREEHSADSAAVLARAEAERVTAATRDGT
jgi:uncharacterized protein (TIGR03089 family)